MTIFLIHISYTTFLRLIMSTFMFPKKLKYFNRIFPKKIIPIFLNGIFIVYYMLNETLIIIQFNSLNKKQNNS